MKVEADTGNNKKRNKYQKRRNEGNKKDVCTSCFFQEQGRRRRHQQPFSIDKETMLFKMLSPEAAEINLFKDCVWI